MRNLYSRLGVDSSASAEQIRNAIRECSHATVRKNAEEILLVRDRRREYDQLNFLLIDIGSMRANLAISHADNWADNIAAEYTGKGSKVVSRYDVFAQKVENWKVGEAKRMVEQIREHRTNDKIKSDFFQFAVWMAIIAGGFWFFTIDSPPVTSQTAVKPTKEASIPRQIQIPSPPKPTFNAPPLTTPGTGTVRRFFDQSVETTQLEIQTSSDHNYLVKLETISGKQVMDIFIRGGDTYDGQAPLGNYIIKYATGSVWYGYEHYFGPKAGYQKAKPFFSFEKEWINDGVRQGYRSRGHTIKLYSVRNGNLETIKISPAEF